MAILLHVVWAVKNVMVLIFVFLVLIVITYKMVFADHVNLTALNAQLA